MSITSQNDTYAHLFTKPVMLISLRAKSGILWSCTATVIALGIFREWFVAAYGVETIFQDMRHIALDAEMCLAAWYSSLLLVTCAFLLAIIANQASRYRHSDRHFWRVLSIVFVALSLDEATSVHELALEPLQHAWHTSGPFLFAWVIPALALTPLFGLAYLGFLRRLPKPYGAWFFLSGLIYVGGALGMEMVGGAIASTAGEQGLAYTLSFIVEESLEMIGATSFLLALLHFMDHESSAIKVQL